MSLFHSFSWKTTFASNTILDCKLISLSTLKIYSTLSWHPLLTAACQPYCHRFVIICFFPLATLKISFPYVFCNYIVYVWISFIYLVEIWWTSLIQVLVSLNDFEKFLAISSSNDASAPWPLSSTSRILIRYNLHGPPYIFLNLSIIFTSLPLFVVYFFQLFRSFSSWFLSSAMSNLLISYNLSF